MAVVVGIRRMQPLITPNAVYFAASDGIIRFSGGSFENISLPVFDYLITGGAPNPAAIPGTIKIYFGIYNPTRREVAYYVAGDGATPWPYGVGFLIYQEDTKTWFFQSASFDNQPTASSACFFDGYLCVAGLFKAHIETTLPSATCNFDDAAGVSFMTPVMETQDLDFGWMDVVKDMEPLQLFAEYRTSGESGSFGTTGVKVEAARRDKFTDTVTYTATGTWTASKKNNIIDEIRLSGGIMRFRITPTVTSGKVCSGFRFHGFRVYVTGIPRVES